MWRRQERARIPAGAPVAAWPPVPQDAEAIVRPMGLAFGAWNDDPSKLPFYDRVVREATAPAERLQIGRRALARSGMKPFPLGGDLRIAAASVEVLGLPRIEAIKRRAPFLAWRERGLDAADRETLARARKARHISLGLMALSHVILLAPGVAIVVVEPPWTSSGHGLIWLNVGWFVFAAAILIPLWWWEILFPKTGTPWDDKLMLTVAGVLERGADPKQILNADGAVNHPALLAALGRKPK